MYAMQRARLLLGCYRTGEANDPETYVAAITATLARYSEAIITEVTHPATGLPSRSSWLPTIKEVFEACEILAQRVLRMQERERRVHEQLAAREVDEARPRASIADLKAKHGEDWGLTAKDAKPSAPAPSWKEIVTTYRADPSRIERLLKKDSDITDLEEHIDGGFSPSSI
jgi:hypothetical protein